MTGISEEQANKHIQENMAVPDEACLSESEISQRMAENDIEMANILQIKKELKGDSAFNDSPMQGHPDFLTWMPIIRDTQPDLLPVDLIETIR